MASGAASLLNDMVDTREHVSRLAPSRDGLKEPGRAEHPVLVSKTMKENTFALSTGKSIQTTGMRG